MKIIFFSSILIIFFTHLLAGKTAILFRHKTDKNFEWKKLGDQKSQPKYEGNIKNGNPDGYGKLTYVNGNKYEGNWKNGEPHGKGTFYWPDGRKYSGFFKNGKPNGPGSYNTKNGDQKQGKWDKTEQKFLLEKEFKLFKGVKDKKYGVLSYRKENARWGWFDYGEEEKDGKYVGEIENMKPNGYGKFTYGLGRWKGDKYEGIWKNGKFNGQGKLIRTNGEKFVGEWKNNALWNISKFGKFGKLQRKYVNGVEVSIKKNEVAKKKTKSVKKKKRGILFMHTPRFHWEDGIKKWIPSGDVKIHGKYEGEISNGVPNGQGIYSWFNVNKYVGEFYNGMFHGKGTYYSLPSEVKVEGEFRRDKIWNAIRKNKEGEIIGTYVNGKLSEK